MDCGGVVGGGVVGAIRVVGDIVGFLVGRGVGRGVVVHSTSAMIEQKRRDQYNIVFQA